MKDRIGSWCSPALVSMWLLGAACGKSSTDSRTQWLGAKLVPSVVEAKGVKIHVDVPEGLPENKESLVGPDWHGEVRDPGPRLTIRLRAAAYKHPEELARDVEPDPKRLDLVELGKQALDGGRLRYVSSTNGNRHLDVAIWIPIDDGRGLQGSCHWYAGSGSKQAAQPDAELVAWLTKICDSIRPER